MTRSAPAEHAVLRLGSGRRADSRDDVANNGTRGIPRIWNYRGFDRSASLWANGSHRPQTGRSCGAARNPIRLPCFFIKRTSRQYSSYSPVRTTERVYTDGREIPRRTLTFSKLADNGAPIPALLCYTA